MTDQEKQRELERFAEVFHQFQQGILPAMMPPRDRSKVVGIEIRAIIMHRDQSTSLAVLRGAKSGFLEALESPELDETAHGEPTEEWSEDPRDRSTGRFDIN